jgi:hypothetical protein
MEIMHPGGSYVFACLLSRKRICLSNLRSIRCICVGPARRPDIVGIREIRGHFRPFSLYGQSLLCGLGVHILNSVHVAHSAVGATESRLFFPSAVRFPEKGRIYLGTEASGIIPRQYVSPSTCNDGPHVSSDFPLGDAGSSRAGRR